MKPTNDLAIIITMFHVLRINKKCGTRSLMFLDNHDSKFQII
jgi:hypothetical protein